MEINPEVLLQSDVTGVDVKEREKLVDALLKLYDEERLFDKVESYKHYKKLNHPGLENQLRPYIVDKNKSFFARRAAINMAEACKLHALQKDLVDISLDSSQPLSIRVEAAQAVNLIGSNEMKSKLKPLAMGEAGEDPEDELKGYGLQAGWPGHLTTEELFNLVSPPKHENFFGGYQNFLWHNLVQHLNPNDLSTALKWVEKQEPRHKLPFSFIKLVDAIMLKAWEYLDYPGVLEDFACAVLSRIKHYDDIVTRYDNPSFEESVANEVDKRHRVVESIVNVISREKVSIWMIFHGKPSLILDKDFFWIIERLKGTTGKEAQVLWAELTKFTLDWGNPVQIDAIIVTSEKISALEEVFKDFLKPVEIDSPEAGKMKKSYSEMQKWRNEDEKQPLLDPSPAERIALLLRESELGKLSSWWRLNREMTLKPNSSHYGNELEPDLTTLPGWEKADALIKARIVEAAKKYVLEQYPQTTEWLGKNILYRPAFAGYRALLLLLKEAPAFVNIILPTLWKKWAPIILAYPTSSGSEDANPHQKLVKLAYRYAPEEIIQTLMVMIDKENREHGYIDIIRKVDSCWDAGLANALLDKVKDEKLKPESMGCLLRSLLEHNVSEAKAFAESLIFLHLPSDKDQRSIAIIAARELMKHSGDAGWPVLWPAMQQQVDFGREVMEAIAHHFNFHSTNVGQRLSEDQLADLYLWLVRQYPYTEDSKHNGAHWVSPRENIAEFRDSILNNLKNRGTYQACSALQKIVAELPELPWLRWTVLGAQEIMRRKTWEPLTPSEILKITNNGLLRLVQSGDQLLEVLIESLQRLEAKLQGETPASRDLWDCVSDGVYRPIKEEDFSDYVSRHLDEDLRQKGIIVNREVRIHRGERTDIHVDAVFKSSEREGFDSITVIIEVKGCWHQKLFDAMKTQLLDQYLNDNHCQYGLYLIGWFNCDLWDQNDYRKKQSPQIDIGEARKQFDDQASKLSVGGIRIKAFVINGSLNR